MKQFTINPNLTLTADEVVNAANNILSTYHIFFCAADSSLSTGTQEDNIVLWPKLLPFVLAESEANEWAGDLANDVASDYGYLAEGLVDHDDYPDDDDWYDAVEDEMEQSLCYWVDYLETLDELCEAIDELHGGIQSGATDMNPAELEYIRSILYVLDEARAALDNQEEK